MRREIFAATHDPQVADACDVVLRLSGPTVERLREGSPHEAPRALTGFEAATGGPTCVSATAHATLVYGRLMR